MTIIEDTRMHEFHPAKPPHVQSMHGNRGKNVGKSAPKASPPATPEPKAFRKRAPKAVGEKPKLADITGKAKASNRDTVKAAQKIYGGKFGGLSVDVTEATTTYDNSMVIAGNITNAEGHRVGTFTRTIARPREGEPYAAHGSLYLSPKVQGQSFAEEFNRNAVQWYRDNGVKTIRLHAADDVGGYAWARAGYDFADANSGKAIMMRVLAAAEPGSVPDTQRVENNMKRIPADRLAEQQRLAGDLFDRSETAEFGSVGYPTPYEVSQLGRWPGAGKDDMWIGKAIMLGSSWKGVRYL